MTDTLRSHFNADGSRELNDFPTVSQLSPLVWRILGLNPGPFALTGTCTYLIGSGPRRLLLDCGDGQSERYLAELQRCMNEAGCTGLDAIVITHWHWVRASTFHSPTPHTTAVFAAGGLLAADGRCKVLDRAADGYARGEAVAVFCVGAPGAKAAPAAHGVWVLGSALNQDGRSSALSAPSGLAQMLVMSAGADAFSSRAPRSFPPGLERLDPRWCWTVPDS
jgi:hypothetical protein